MQDNTKQEEPNEEIRKRAIKRVGAAAALALIAAIGLTMLSSRKPPQAPESKPEQTVLPAEPPAPAAESPTPADQTTAMEPAPASAVAESLPEHDAPPTIASPPPPPQVVNVPQTPSASPPKAVKPAATKPSSEKAAESSAKPAPPVAEKSGSLRVARELVAIPIKETPSKSGDAAVKANELKKPAEAQKTAEQAKPASSAPPSPAPASQPPAAVAATKGYAVQLGVFSNPANAMQMQEKLTQHGIQSYTETKLNVGPFKNKAEADQALAKVRALGIGAVVVPLR